MGPIPAEAWGTWIKSAFFFTKMWNEKENNLVRSSCSAPALWVLRNLGWTLLFWPVCRSLADSSNTLTSAVLDFPEPKCHKKLWVCFFLISIPSVSLLVLQFRHESTMTQEDNLKIEWYTHIPCLLTRNTTPPTKWPPKFHARENKGHDQKP